MLEASLRRRGVTVALLGDVAVSAPMKTSYLYAHGGGAEPLAEPVSRPSTPEEGLLFWAAFVAAGLLRAFLVPVAVVLMAASP